MENNTGTRWFDALIAWLAVVLPLENVPVRRPVRCALPDHDSWTDWAEGMISVNETLEGNFLVSKKHSGIQRLDMILLSSGYGQHLPSDKPYLSIELLRSMGKPRLIFGINQFFVIKTQSVAMMNSERKSSKWLSSSKMDGLSWLT